LWASQDGRQSKAISGLEEWINQHARLVFVAGHWYISLMGAVILIVPKNMSGVGTQSAALPGIRRMTMSKKTAQLLIAYFPTADFAREAAEFVKEWDKNIIEIDLGAMGILTMNEDGKVKTEKIGDRATGKGAKWGLLVGAVTGIFTGGLTLVGGALAGLAVGSVTGALFHRGLGMTDQQKEQLESHLKDGGAALAVITPEEQVQPTVSVLSDRSKEVSVFRMDDETVQELQEAGGDADE
jgi:uncharacterized membrane protein